MEESANSLLSHQWTVYSMYSCAFMKINYLRTHTQKPSHACSLTCILFQIYINTCVHTHSDVHMYEFVWTHYQRKVVKFKQIQTHMHTPTPPIRHLQMTVSQLLTPRSQLTLLLLLRHRQASNSALIIHPSWFPVCLAVGRVFVNAILSLTYLPLFLFVYIITNSLAPICVPLRMTYWLIYIVYILSIDCQTSPSAVLSDNSALLACFSGQPHCSEWG